MAMFVLIQEKLPTAELDTVKQAPIKEKYLVALLKDGVNSIATNS